MSDDLPDMYKRFHKEQTFMDKISGSRPEFYEKEGKATFGIDEKCIEEFTERLNEPDRMYKFKKHYMVKGQNYKLNSPGNAQAKQLKHEEESYMRKVFEAEDKLYSDKPLNAINLLFLIGRNYPLFTEIDRKQLDKYKTYYYTGTSVGLAVSVVMTSIAATSLEYLGLTFKKKSNKYILFSGLFLSYAGSMFYLIDSAICDSANSIVFGYKDVILNRANEYKKVPFGYDMKSWDPHNLTHEDLI